MNHFVSNLQVREPTSLWPHEHRTIDTVNAHRTLSFSMLSLTHPPGAAPQYYMMLEVLEGSWALLVQGTGQATSMDEFIAAHNQVRNPGACPAGNQPFVSSVQRTLQP